MASFFVDFLEYYVDSRKLENQGKYHYKISLNSPSPFFLHSTIFHRFSIISNASRFGASEVKQGGK
jgi:hypothetical protein